MGFSIVIAITLFIFFLLNAFHVLSYIIAIDGSVNYLIAMDDNGTIMVSLMQAGKDKPYSGVFAELCTAGHREGIENELNETLDTLEKRIKVYYGSIVCYQQGDADLKKSIKTRVALPGGRTGYMEIGE